MTEYQPRKGGSYKRTSDGKTVLVSRTESAPVPAATPAATATPKPAPSAKSDAAPAPAPTSKE